MSANVWILILSIVVVALVNYILFLKFGCSGDGSCRADRVGGREAAGQPEGVNDETVAAIALALSLYNGGITTRRNGNVRHNGSHWNSKAFAMSEMPERKRR